jgi:hypothetical protein
LPHRRLGNRGTPTFNALFSCRKKDAERKATTRWEFVNTDDRGNEGFLVAREGEAWTEGEAWAQGGPWAEGIQWAHRGGHTMGIRRASLEPDVWADGGWGPNEDVDGEGVGVIPNPPPPPPH